MKLFQNYFSNTEHKLQLAAEIISK